MKRLNLLSQSALLVATIIALNTNAHAELNAPVTANADIAQGTGKKTVLIYYVNETHEDAATRKNTDTILGYLRSSNHDGVQELADAIERDRTKFAKTVNDELAAIRIAVNAGKLTSVAVFRNEMVSQGEYQYAAVGDLELTTAKITVPGSGDFVQTSHPLSGVDGLQAALQAAADRFSPHEHEFVLVTKSHGSPERAMIPRIGLNIRSMTQHELLAKLTNSKQQAEGELDKPKILGQHPSDPLGQHAGDPLGQHAGDPLGQHAGDPLGVKGTVLGGEAGTTKEAYVQTLATFSRKQGMKFRLVFVESCSSELSAKRVSQLKGSVGQLYTSDIDGLEYNTLDYQTILNSPTTDIAETLSNALNSASGE